MTATKPQYNANLSLVDRLALFPEPTREVKQAAHEAAKADQERTRLDRKHNASSILEPGTTVRIDIYGWRGHDARVVSDDGPANLGHRRIKLEKISGRNAGETTLVSRERVKCVPVAGV